MATKKKGKTTKTKKASAKKTKTVSSSSRAPYILIIMAMMAVLLFLLSFQSDSIRNLLPKKNSAVVKENDAHVSDINAGKKTVDTSHKITDSKDVIKQELSPKEKTKEKEVGTIAAKIYFLYYNEKADKIELRPVVREVNAKFPVKSALEELIKGPTKVEYKKGYVTAIPPTLKVIDVSIINNIAFINFNGVLEEGAAGNIMLNRLDQIIYTATQFDTVEGIHILVDGQRKRFLGPDGISVAGPLKRH